MNSEETKQSVLYFLELAQKEGISIKRAARFLCVELRNCLRWKKSLVDKRKINNSRPKPNQLTAEEVLQITETVCSDRFKDDNPHQIVAKLADEGIYLASESSFYRILRMNGLLKHRGNSKPKNHKKPDELVAVGPNQVWSWDITYLKTTLNGAFFYLYMFVDIWSRKIMAWEIHLSESKDEAARMFEMACVVNDVQKGFLSLHSDNGGPMKSVNMLSMMQKLGVTPSYSRPHVSDDNPYSESLFKTLKYLPGYPGKFSTIEEAKAWVEEFVNWYNNIHKHSAIKFVTPAERHLKMDTAILEKRKKVYEEARKKKPIRWSKNIRNWDPIKEVILNPSLKKEKLTKVA